MNDIIVAYQKGTLPKSVESALINQTECIKQVDEEIDLLHSQMDDLNQKMEICKEIGMPVKGIKNQITRKKKAIDSLIRARAAYQAGFLEIPELNRQARELDTDNDEGNPTWFKEVLPSTAPLRVFEDLKAAKESGLFEKIVFYQPVVNNDPIIAGRIGIRVFLISNYH